MVDAAPPPRRSPQGTARLRDAERSKRAILDAAVVEFARHGYTGARVSRIAERAGLNKQLISYYFGGKEGLRDAVGDQWRAGEGDLYDDGMSLAEVVANYVRANIENPDLNRLLSWEALGDYVPDRADDAARAERMRAYVADIARRQEGGEVPAGIDPRALALVLFAAASGPVTFTPIATAMGIEEPLSAETGTWYADQVRLIVSALAPPASAD